MLHVSTLNLILSISKVRSNDEMVKLCGDGGNATTQVIKTVLCSSTVCLSIEAAQFWLFHDLLNWNLYWWLILYLCSSTLALIHPSIVFS